MTRSALRRTVILVGVATSSILVAVFIARLDWNEFRKAMSNVEWVWIFAGGACLLASMSVRAMRWLVVSKTLQLAAFPAYWDATVIGYLGNVLYPGRAGEILRVAALHQAIRMPPGQALATAFMDRMTDLIALAIVAAYVMTVVAGSRLSDNLVGPLVTVAVVAMLGFLFVLMLGHKLEPLAIRAASVLPPRWRERIPRWFSQAVVACRHFARPKRLLAAVVLTFAAFCLDYAALWLFIAAFDWQLPVEAAMTIGVFLAIGSLLPAAPGYVGIYQVACVLALHLYGIGESAALAYSVVAQAAMLLLVSATGLTAAWRQGLRLGAEHTGVDGTR